MKDFAPTCSLTELRAFVTRNLASAEPGSVSRSILGKGTALRLTEPRSIRVAWLRGAMRAVLFRGVLALAALAGTGPAFAGGTVTNLTQADLQAALAGGGTVLFAVSGTLTLTNTIAIVQDTVLDAHGFAVTLSGGGAVRLFQVATNVTFAVNGLTLADGRFVGATGADGDPPAPGQDGAGAAILNLAGTVNLTGCTFANHFVQGGDAGRDLVNETYNNRQGGNGLGAALCTLGGSVNLTNCVVAGNAAKGGQGSALATNYYEITVGDAGAAWGGAIYSSGGRVNLQSVTLTSNSTVGGSPRQDGFGNYARAGDAAGGALFAINSALYVGSSALASNTATGTGAPFNATGVGSASGGAVFLAPGSTGTLDLSTFSNNSATGGSVRGPTGGAGRGGAVFNAAELRVSNCSFSGNNTKGGVSITAGVGQGGAICSSNVLVITACTFASNLVTGGAGYGGFPASPGAAGEGGAIWSAGVLAATNSTCAANDATGGATGNASPGFGGPGRGGAVFIAGGTATLINVTLAANRADGGGVYGSPPFGPAQGGGLANTNGAVTVRGSIIANSANGGEVWGTLTDAGYNLCSDNTANFSATGSLNNTAPLLAALGDNGGPTKTMALLAGSPARDAIPSGFPPTDQRGVSRPQGPAADFGAFEAGYSAWPPTIATQPVSQTNGAGGTTTFTVAASGSEPLSYQWRKDGVGLQNGGTASGVATPALTLSNLLRVDAGGYSVVVTNPYGSVTSVVASLVVVDPLITRQPASQSKITGESVTFDVVATGTPPLLYQWRKDGGVLSAATGASLTLTNLRASDAGGYDVVVTGGFGAVTSMVASLTVNPSWCDAFNPGVKGLEVDSLALQADGKILVGGFFSALGGQSQPNLGRLNADGSLDSTFSSGAGSNVLSLAVQTDGKLLAAGSFFTLAGQSHKFLGRLNADGGLDASFNPGPDRPVFSLALQADGKILAGGLFTMLGGTNCNALGRLNADGSLDASFHPGAGNPAFTVALQGDGKILVGGSFTTLGGQNRAHLGRLNADGSLDVAFNPGASGFVWCLAVQADGRILVGGTFTTLGGQSCTNIGRLNPDGSLDTSFNPGADAGVRSLAVQADGKILAGGFFTTLGGQSRANLGRLNADGSSDLSFNPGAGGGVACLAVQADGQILVGGSYTMLGGESRTNLGRLINTAPATESLTSAASVITWLRGGTAPEVWRTTFDASTNGTDWTALGTGTRIAGGWQLNQLSVPAGARLRARGFVTSAAEYGSSWFVETRAVTPPKLTVVGLGPGGFRFTFPSVAGVSYVTEFSERLVPGAWAPLDQRTGAGGLETVDDPSAGLGTRFYRVVTR